MENMRNVKIPQGGPAAGRLVRLALIGGAGLYAASNSLFNVEGGHRAIVFNRLVGIKERVSQGEASADSQGPLTAIQISEVNPRSLTEAVATCQGRAKLPNVCRCTRKVHIF